MKFTSNVKPLQDVLDLVVVPSNISKFYAKSTILQVSIDSKGQLILNSEADSVISEARLKGSVDKIESTTTFVDSVQFKALIATLDSPTVQLDFDGGHIVVQSGRSKFSIPNPGIDGTMALQSPVEPSGTEFDLKSDIWKSVKDKQMYSLSDNFVKLVYTYIFNGTKEIMVGDYMNGLFTRTPKVGLPSQCLLSSNVVSVILSVDNDSKGYHVDRSFVIVSTTDTYQFISELKPKYETSPEVGSYNSEMISELFTKADMDGILLPIVKVKLLLLQSNLLLEGDSPSIKWSCADNILRFTSDKGEVDGEIEGKLTGKPKKWELEFKLKNIMSVISNLDGENIGVYPSFQEEGDEVICNALVFKDDSVEVILAGLEK